MSQALTMDGMYEQSAWKSRLNWTAAILSAIIFLAAGLFHTLDPILGAVLMTQLKIPQAISIPFTVALGIVEIFTGVLFLMPGYRRVASWLGVAMLLAFMIYIGYNYNELRGVECSCFPWVKRSVNPAFFAEDLAMMIPAIIAGMWTAVVRNFRLPLLILGATIVFAGVSYGVAISRPNGTKGPDTILVDGKPYSIARGKVFIYYYDPECMHCLDAGERMAKMDWGSTKFVGQPVVHPQFAPAFNERTGLKGVTASDFELLKKTFPYKGTPAGVALVDGREVSALSQFEAPEPAVTLQKLGFAK